MINATITGRLTKTPELRYTADKQPVANYRIASDNRGDGTSYLDITIWGKAAEAAAEHLVKGQHVTVSGLLESSEYTNDQGIKRTSWELTQQNSEWHAKPAAHAAQN